MMIDISKIDMERINGLLDKLDEITNKINSMKHIIEEYHSGTQWYKIWSDGWIEQGGYMSAGISDTITFIKPFTNTEYFSAFTPYKNMGSHIVYIKSRYNDRISIYNGDNKEIPISWYACGY